MPLSSRSQFVSVVGISCVAAFITVQGHEILGHGLAAYLYGARSFYLGPTGIEFTLPGLPTVFNPSPLAGRWISAAGALFNFVMGITFYMIFRKTHNASSVSRYFLWLVATLNIFTLPSYMTFSAIFHKGDWQVVLDGLPHEAAIRFVMVCSGILVYFVMIRIVAAGLATFADGPWRLTLTPYLVTVLIYCAAASLSPVHKHQLLLSAFRGNLISNCGLLIAAPWAMRLSKGATFKASKIAPNITWGILGLFATVLLLRIGLGVSCEM